MSSNESSTETAKPTSGLRVWLLFTIASAPLLLAIWCFPWFLTQDAPFHLYNAEISRQRAAGHQDFAKIYSFRGALLPFIGGHEMLYFLQSFLPARLVDRLIMTITSVGFAAALVWFRQRLVGPAGLALFVPLSILIAGSRLWLLGLYPFLLGSLFVPIILALWWKWRNDLGPVRALVLAALLLFGYVFHIISTAVIVVGLAVLALLTPGNNFRRRLLWTAAASVPVIALILRFRSATVHSEGSGLNWIGLDNARSITSWLTYLQDPDFLSISFRSSVLGFLLPSDCPFVETPSQKYAIFWPVLWLVIALLLLARCTLANRPSAGSLLRQSCYRGWFCFAVVLLALGLFGPSDVGEGSILRERLLVFAVIVMVPLVRFQWGQRMARVAAVLLWFSAIAQIAFVYDYASRANRIASDFVSVAGKISSGQRVAGALVNTSTHYLVSPLPNLIDQVGVESRAIIWNNYGPNYSYSPVAFANDESSDTTNEVLWLNEVLISDEAESLAEADPEQWVKNIDLGMSETDVLVVWGSAPWFEKLNERWFEAEPFFERGELRAF